VISGLQIASSPSPFIVTQPTNQLVAPGATVTFSVVAGGVMPLAYQWVFNNVDISAATHSTYIVTNAQAADVGNYSVIVRNAYGSVTTLVAALGVISPVANKIIDVDFTSSSVTSEIGFAAIGVTTSDLWNTCTPTTWNGYAYGSGALANLKFMDGSESGAGLTVAGVTEVAGNGASDPMYASYLWTEGMSITVAVTNLITGWYDFYLYGHGNMDNQNSVFLLMVGSQSYGSEATINGSGWLSSVWQEGVQYVEFTNVYVSAGQTVTITAGAGAGFYSVFAGLQIATVGPPAGSPFIVNQPADHAVFQGSTATFNVVAAGTMPLAYQWLFDTALIPSATNNTYSVTNAQPANAGSYSVIVTNVMGSVTSAEVALNVLIPGPAARLIDVAFTTSSVTSKTGFAATGLRASDFWNTCTFIYTSLDQGYGALPSLKFVDGSVTGAGLTVANAAGDYGNGASDPMYSTYLFQFPNFGNITVTVTNLITSTYNFYLYGHGNVNNQNSVFQLTVGSQSYGSEATINGSGWLSSIWQEGVQYVEFANVSVSNGQTVTITVEPGTAGYAVLSGLQMGTLTLPSNGGPLMITSSNQFVNVNQEVVTTNYAYTPNGPISFTLASNAPVGASIDTNGIFRWTPTCEQGSTTNLITVWATDSSTPPLSNSMTFSVVVGECVEISIGSNVQQIGHNTCVPVNLFTTISLTNLNFTLADPTGHFTNWNITPDNSVIGSATAQLIDPLRTLFTLGVRNGHALQGFTSLGTICMDILSGPSAFVPLLPSNMGADASDNSPITYFIAQPGRVVAIGSQSLLDASLGTNSSRTLTLYGNPGVNYGLLSTTNLTDSSSWSTVGSVTLTDLFQVVNLSNVTNQVQFFKAVQP
jgi:hypothetical protein